MQFLSIHLSRLVINKKVFESNKNKYILLDCKFLDNCEIADIYDKHNNQLFHNKKIADLRVLSHQILNGVLILKDDEFIKKHETKFIEYKMNEINRETFKYVFGLIKTETEKITPMNKLAIGTTCYLLDQLNITYYVDMIKFIPDENRNKKMPISK